MGLTNFFILENKLSIIPYMLILLCLIQAVVLLFISHIWGIAYKKRLFEVPGIRKVRSKEMDLHYFPGTAIPIATIDFLNLVFCLLACVFLFLASRLWMFPVLVWVVQGVLLAFFYYDVFGNVRHFRNIFMGDTGNLTLNFLQVSIIND